MKACPDAAPDYIFCAIKARKRYLELFNIIMEIWRILEAERENTLTISNLTRYIKTEWLITSIDDIHKVKKRMLPATSLAARGPVTILKCWEGLVIW